MENKYDLVIVGAGPAGLNAALYASRANLNVAFVEKGAPGGKLSSTSKIENWIGTEIVEGWKLATDFFEHAQKYGAKYVYGDVVEINRLGDYDFEIILKNGEKLFSKTVLIAVGMTNRRPTFVKNHQMYENRGMSFCAICDGPMFKGHPTVVLGAGNSAVEESVYLSSIASEVHIVLKDDKFTAEPRLVDDLLKLPNVYVYKNSQIDRLEGENSLERVYVINQDGKEVEIFAKSFFPYIGMEPNAGFVKHYEHIFDDKGFIITNNFMETAIPGLFAAGDIRSKDIRQIITAASDGAIAGKKIVDLINAEAK
ncbi:FAD-binding protein [Mycoplasma sp. NEAQ87857]|uniref:NAD(P)/FAD-dependent oxidoreductase n=1 Tax=Mycoplasma sp. NEAQ87857 TaxID=2683967 RepID=UPI001317C344|nr:FAD-dependent oxidoreductase [Mycoplasma sp. NEAQ87857]QGZ97413.1 FAD-binding protein [Mycoplasma sp. NEAQ87857]